MTSGGPFGAWLAAAWLAAQPARDVDAVGTLESSDRCPDAAETRNGFDDDDGCPDAVPAEVTEILGVVADVVFELEKDVLRPSSRAALDRIVAVLRRYPGARVVVAGHRADDGGESYGRDLTRMRAQAVMKYLIEHGVEARQLEAKGYGSSVPIDTNKTAAGRARNRRIELNLRAW